MTSSTKPKEDDSSDDEIETKAFKAIFLGDGAVGKTSIILRFTNDHFDPEQKYKQTIGLDFFLKQLEIQRFLFFAFLLFNSCFVDSLANLQVSLQCWDIGGQTIGQKMIRSYLKGSHAILFVYDVTNQESFNNLTKWMSFVEEVFAGQPKRPYMALIGNKSSCSTVLFPFIFIDLFFLFCPADLGYKRVVSLEAHSAFASKYKMRFFYMFVQKVHFLFAFFELFMLVSSLQVCTNW